MVIERPRTLGVPMTEEEYAEVTRLAKENGMTRTAFIRMIIRNIIKEKEIEDGNI